MESPSRTANRESSGSINTEWVSEVWRSFYEQVRREKWPQDQVDKVKAEILQGIEMEMKGQA